MAPNRETMYQFLIFWSSLIPTGATIFTVLGLYNRNVAPVGISKDQNIKN